MTDDFNTCSASVVSAEVYYNSATIFDKTKEKRACLNHFFWRTSILKLFFQKSNDWAIWNWFEKKTIKIDILNILTIFQRSHFYLRSSILSHILSGLCGIFEPGQHTYIHFENFSECKETVCTFISVDSSMLPFPGNFTSAVLQIAKSHLPVLTDNLQLIC